MPKLNVKTVKLANLDKMEKVDLAKVCKRSGLHPGGPKELLIDRIRAAKADEPVSA